MKFLILFLFLPLQAFAQNWSLQSEQAPRLFIESVTSGDKAYEIVYLPNGASIEVPVDLKELGAGTLPPEMVDQLREISRKVLEQEMRALVSEKFGGDIVIDEDGYLTAPTLTDENGVTAKPANLLRRLTRVNYVEEVKRLALISWHFIVVETYRAGVEYVKRFKKAAPSFKEYGIAIDFKIEPQIYLGKFNPTQRFKWTRKSYAFFIEVSFNRETKKLALHTRLRREKGSGGFGLPAVKAEMKFFETDGTHTPQAGVSWYPVSPPVLSFVLDRDHANHYFAQGLTIGFNTGDLVPGSTLTNSFTEYQQIEDPIHFEKVPGVILDAMDQAYHTVVPRSPGMCSAIFEAI